MLCKQAVIRREEQYITHYQGSFIYKLQKTRAAKTTKKRDGLWTIGVFEGIEDGSN